jgi:Aspartyl protease
MRTHKALHVAALVLASFLSCAGVSQTVQSTLKLQVLGGVPVVDGVFVNGQGPYRFMLDTGGETNQMDAGLAKKLGLAGSFVRQIGTPAGSSEIPGTDVDKVTLGALEAPGQEFLISSRASFHDISPDVRGILGQRFLAQLDYTMDFRHHRITFGDQPPAGNRVNFQLVYGCMTVPTDLGQLMLDSGTDRLLLFRASEHGVSSKTTTSNAVMAVSVDRAPSLHIGDRRYYPSTVAFHEVNDVPMAGLLPASLFHAIFVSNSGGYVVFDPNER